MGMHCWPNLVYSLKRITPPKVELVSVGEAKSWAKVQNDQEDDAIQDLILSACETIEDFTNRALVSQTHQLFLDRFPGGPTGEIRPPRAPLQSVTSITYVDPTGSVQTLHPNLYQVDTSHEPGRIRPAYERNWPTTRAMLRAVTVTFVAGYGDRALLVPHRLRQAVKVAVAHWYEHRTEVGQLPQGLQNFLLPCCLNLVV